MNKKILIPLALISIASFSLVGCSDNSTKNDDKDNDKVIVGVFDELKSETNDKSTENNEILSFEDTKEDTKEDKLKIFDENVSLKYPSSWDKDTVQGSTVYYIDNLSTNINLVKESFRGYSEDEYIKASIKSVKESFNTENVLMTEDTFNGYGGYTLTYETDVQGQSVKLVQSTIFFNGDAYIFTLGGFPKNVDKQVDNVMSILDTVEFD